MSMRSLIQRAITTLALVATVGTTGSVATAQEVNFGIVDEASYQKFLRAVRSAEYVREDYIVGYVPDMCPDDGDVTEVSTPGTKPRVVAVVAATMAFVERNPELRELAIGEFIDAYDAALQAAVPDDPDLTRTANFLHAVRYVQVRSDPNDSALDDFIGADTDVGERALELLGIVAPRPDGFIAVQNRMVHMERAASRNFGPRPEFGMLLVHGFLNQDASGNPRHGSLSALLRSYLNENGYWATWGETTRPELCGVNAAIDAMPATYEDYLLALNSGLDDDPDDGISNPYQSRLVSAIAEAFDISQARIDEMVDLLANEPSLYESVDYASDDVYLQQVIDRLNANMRESSEARSTIFSTSLMLMQSEYEDMNGPVARYASRELDLGSAVIGVNSTYAYLGSSAQIAGSLAVLGTAYYQKDPVSAAGAAADIFSEVLGIAGTSSNGSTEDDIYDQVIQMRVQLADMQTQLNERFDRVEAKLDLIYGSMMDGMMALGEQIGDLQDDVNGLIRDVYISRSQLSRLEAALFGVAQDILLQDFMRAADEVLDYRSDNVTDLPYDQTDPNFRSAASELYTFTSSASGTTFAGIHDRDNAFLLSMADETVGSGPHARYLNDLVVNVHHFGVSYLSTQPVVAPEPWAHGASAYVQLAKESPWYFAYMYNAQNNSWQNGGSPPDLRTIISLGEEYVDMIEAARDAALFDALVQNYKDAADNLQIAIDNAIRPALENNVPIPLANDEKAIDLWAQDGGQPLRPLAPRVSRVVADWGDSSDNLPVPDLGWHAYQLMVGRDRGIEMSKRAELHTILLANENEGVWRTPYWHSDVSGNRQKIIFTLPDGVEFNGDVERTRTFKYKYEFFNGFSWTEVEFANNVAAAEMFKQIWKANDGEFSLQGYATIGNDLSDTTWSTNDGDHRITILQDTFNGWSEQELDMVLAEGLNRIRSEYMRPHIANLIRTPGNSLYEAALALDDAEAILDAYVTLAMPGALEMSEVMTSALHSVPGSSELGLRSADVLALIQDFTDYDDSIPDDWGDPTYDIQSVGAILGVRVDELHAEINRALEDFPLEASPYVEWMLAEAASLRDNASRLAIDDLFVTYARIFREGNLLDNDVWQEAGAGEFRPIEVDLGFGPGDEGYIAPSNGDLILRSDGSFIYIADAGFTGADRFTYRARCDVSDNGAGVFAYSQPALVSIRVRGSDDSLGEESEESPGSVTRIQP